LPSPNSSGKAFFRAGSGTLGETQDDVLAARFQLVRKDGGFQQLNRTYTGDPQKGEEAKRLVRSVIQLIEREMEENWN